MGGDLGKMGLDCAPDLARDRRVAVEEPVGNEKRDQGIAHGGARRAGAFRAQQRGTGPGHRPHGSSQAGQHASLFGGLDDMKVQVVPQLQEGVGRHKDECVRRALGVSVVQSPDGPIAKHNETITAEPVARPVIERQSRSQVGQVGRSAELTGRGSRRRGQHSEQTQRKELHVRLPSVRRSRTPKRYVSHNHTHGGRA